MRRGRVFTDYIQELEPGSEPDPERFRTMWNALRSALAGELRKRSLWHAPPSYLGIYGGTTWKDEEILEELLIDCYAFIFVDRLEGIKGLLEVQDNVEGLVFRNIRNFLYNLQKKHDPLGFRVFGTLRTATRRSIAAGTLHVLEGDPKVRNETVLGFTPWHELGGVLGPELGTLVRSWGDDLLPEIVTARGAGIDEVTARLGRHLAQLEEEGVEAFRFKDVIDLLKGDVRSRWNAIWQQMEGETAFEEIDEELVALVRVVRPDSGFEERQSFRKLLACVDRSLVRRDEVTDKTRSYLQKLWVFVKSQVAERHKGVLPARQRIARLLGIPRYRLPELLGILGDLVESCLGSRREGRPIPTDGKTVSVSQEEARS